MQSEKIDRGFIAYIEKGEKIMDTLTQFCKEKKIENGEITGIGAVKTIEIGVFDTNGKRYIKHYISGVWELVSFIGNITIKDGNPFVHAHALLSDQELNTKGGHLFEATVAAVGEFFIRIENSAVYRKMNEDVGLPCMTINEDRL